MNNTFCPIPWNFQAVRSNGDIRLCCQANISSEQGVLRKKNGESFNAKEGQLSLSRNSDLIKSVRQQMMAGEWSPTCTRCQQEESSGLVSRRQYELEQWPIRLDDVVCKTTKDGSIDIRDFPVEYYDLRFGNLCNLKCRMCGPTDSSAWYDDWVALTGSLEFKDTSGKVVLEKRGDKYVTDEYTWHKSEAFWQDIESGLPTIKHVYMAGGEPLLIKRHYEFLERCVDKKAAQQIVLEYNTNCMQVPQKVLDLWRHFKQVRVGASIDGYGAFAEYQRYPSEWSTVFDNLKILNAQPGNILVWLAYTVTVYNVFHIAEFIKWKLVESGLDNINRTERRPIITPHMAHNPKHLNVRVLPVELKNELIQELQDLEHWICSRDFSPAVKKQSQKIVKSISSYMLSADYNSKYWDQFCSYTKKLDQIRGQNVLDLVPRFSKYLR